MDIAQYISDLLNEHDEVGLPGVGTFFKRRISAYLNTEEGVYYPPSYSVGFKEEVNQTATLIHHIVHSKRISESSAHYFVERFSENITSGLERTAKADVTPLGILTKNQDGYRLESASSNIQADTFGLSAVKEREWIKRSPKPVVQQIEETSTEELITEPARSGWRSLWIAIFSILIITALAAVAYYYYPQYAGMLNTGSTEQKKPKKKVVAPVIKQDAIPDSMSFADSIVSELERQGMTGSEVEKVPDTVTISSKASSPDTVKAQPKPTKVYEIIIASFGLRREAENAARIYRKRGIDAKVIVDDKKPKFKISVATFPTMAAASKENKRIQKEISKDSWILTVNNK
jgi:nucleoid DNA-binding protein